MVIIHHAIYRRKCRISSRSRFSCTNSDGHLKGQSFKTALSGCVDTECRAILKLGGENTANDQSKETSNFTYFFLLVL